ncbi:hypothetical protein ABZ454_10850 [Streptomyces sp. NPDC005803]|uniref:hypothetical protein n=1 Tax=Streptomyces sp. NPDC005803 TaxID=3154297 RepID=UPI0033E0B440
MAKVCVFCGGTPLTKEHVLPRWLKVAMDPTVRTVRYVRLSRDGVQRHDAPPLNDQVKVVCSDCNSGWMNQLEEDVRPFLPDLIRGLPCTLDSVRQRSLASWALKTILMFQYTHRSEVRAAIPSGDFSAFHENRRPTRSMLGRLGFVNYPPDDSVPLLDTLCQGYGTAEMGGVAWIGTLRIGCMLVQIIRAPDVRAEYRLTPYETLPSLRPMWEPDEPIEWPLPAAIPHELMTALALPEGLDVNLIPL